MMLHSLISSLTVISSMFLSRCHHHPVHKHTHIPNQSKLKSNTRHTPTGLTHHVSSHWWSAPGRGTIKVAPRENHFFLRLPQRYFAPTEFRIRIDHNQQSRPNVSFRMMVVKCMREYFRLFYVIYIFLWFKALVCRAMTTKGVYRFGSAGNGVAVQSGTRTI